MSPLLVLTDRRLAPRPLHTVLAAAIEGGARWICVREKDLPAQERLALAKDVAAMLEADGGVCSLASQTGDGYGLHLASVECLPSVRSAVVGRSCHDPAEVAAAEREGLDYVTLSPIFSTDSKPGYGPALGLDALDRVCASTSLPVYALGGITPARARRCLDAGAAGVAVMGEIMRAADPADTTRRFLEELHR